MFPGYNTVPTTAPKTQIDDFNDFNQKPTSKHLLEPLAS